MTVPSCPHEQLPLSLAWREIELLLVACPSVGVETNIDSTDARLILRMPSQPCFEASVPVEVSGDTPTNCGIGLLGQRGQRTFKFLRRSGPPPPPGRHWLPPETPDLPGGEEGSGPPRSSGENTKSFADRLGMGTWRELGPGSLRSSAATAAFEASHGL